MIAKVNSCGLVGLDGYIVEVEIDISMGMPTFDIVGLPDAAVKESRERVRAAVKNSGFVFPSRRIIINLAPAHIKKEGSVYDLPMAVAFLMATNQIQIENVDDFVFIGELSLDGQVRAVSGVLPMVIAARENGAKCALVPYENASEAAVVKGIDIIGVNTLTQLCDHISGRTHIDAHTIDLDEYFKKQNECGIDFSEVKGQENVKRALEIAAAGNHNILMIGSPGSGKSMIAQRLPTILPDMTFEEALEVTKIHSIAGTLSSDTPIITNRPFRHPHHTISAIGLSGGGRVPKPGEVSLAHNGVLFLDELPEFNKDALEVMRQPLEDGSVTIARINATLTYPCNVMFVASMNPCRCGYYGDGSGRCKCTESQVAQYLGKVSGPLLDRIDLHIEVAPVKYKDLENESPTESSSEIKKRVNAARKIQSERYKDYNIYSNSQLTPAMINIFCGLGEQERAIIKGAFDRLGLSARAYNRILKVSRTIADLDESENILSKHIAEAIQYRSLDRKFWS